MVRSIATFVGALAVVTVAGVSAVYLTPVDMPSAASTTGIQASPDLAVASECCVRCCAVRVTYNADGTYTWIESDCTSGQVCRIATGVLRPKRTS